MTWVCKKVLRWFYFRNWVHGLDRVNDAQQEWSPRLSCMRLNCTSTVSNTMVVAHVPGTVRVDTS